MQLKLTHLFLALFLGGKAKFKVRYNGLNGGKEMEESRNWGVMCIMMAKSMYRTERVYRLQVYLMTPVSGLGAGKAISRWLVGNCYHGNLHAHWHGTLAETLYELWAGTSGFLMCNGYLLFSFYQGPRRSVLLPLSPGGTATCTQWPPTGPLLYFAHPAPSPHFLPMLKIWLCRFYTIIRENASSWKPQIILNIIIKELNIFMRGRGQETSENIITSKYLQI